MRQAIHATKGLLGIVQQQLLDAKKADSVARTAHRTKALADEQKKLTALKNELKRHEKLLCDYVSKYRKAVDEGNISQVLLYRAVKTQWNHSCVQHGWCYAPDYEEFGADAIFARHADKYEKPSEAKDLSIDYPLVTTIDLQGDLAPRTAAIPSAPELEHNDKEVQAEIEAGESIAKEQEHKLPAVEAPKVEASSQASAPLSLDKLVKTAVTKALEEREAEEQQRRDKEKAAAEQEERNALKNLLAKCRADLVVQRVKDQQLRQRFAKEEAAERLEEWKNIAGQLAAEAEEKNYNSTVNKIAKIVPTLAVGGTVGFFAGSHAAAALTGISASLLIGACVAGGAVLLLLAAYCINRLVTGMPGFFASQLDTEAEQARHTYDERRAAAQRAAPY